MKSVKPQHVLISGTLLLSKTELASAGDIYLYRRDDQEGRFARAGGYTNAGFSGYFLASVHDGSDWRKLQINELIPYPERSFKFAYQIPEVQDAISRTIGRWRGSTAEYIPTKRAFTIPAHTTPPI